MNLKLCVASLFFVFPIFLSSADPGANASLVADLNGDGKSETISWIKFTTTEDMGDFYQLRVSDKDGQLLWSGPKGTDIDNPLIFGDWDFGYSFPELIADIDGDGAVELIAPEPQSDVSPTGFNVLRWKGGSFHPVRSSVLLERPHGSGKYPWSKGDAGQGTWISSFKKMNPDGSIQVEVFEYKGGKTPRAGVAVVVPTPKGFKMKKWIVPLKVLLDMPSPEPNGSEGAGGVVVYRARLSLEDHYNSKGKQLKSVADILRQDRANYYKGNSDREDGPDPVFRTAKARGGMAGLRLVPVGSSKSLWSKVIISEAPLVEVEVTDKELKVKILKR